MRRYDHELLQNWVPAASRVLDLGCGEGSLMEKLQNNRQAHTVGMEIDSEKIIACLKKGLSVIEQDLDRGLDNLQNDSFDCVVMTQTLQAVNAPDLVLDEMLRVGKQCMITFPNFGHWACRLHLGFKGRMPVSKFMPFSWYDTPNIHFCTVSDFEALCLEKNIKILNKAMINQDGETSLAARHWPNLFAVTAVYHVSK